MKMNKPPLLQISVAPLENIKWKENFFSADNKIIEKLKNPSYLRYSGWNTLTLDNPKIVNGDHWEVRNGDRKVFKLYEDGSFITLARADSTFLAWGTKETETKSYSYINNLAFIEYIYEVVREYKNFSELMVFKDKLICIFELKLVNVLSEQRSTLLVGNTNILSPFRFIEGFSGKITKDIDVIKEYSFDNLNDFDPGKVAFDLISFIYLSAGMSIDKIYYTKKVGDEFQVDLDSITKNG
jgi:hypothetical protein